MITNNEAKVARETLVDVGTPDGALGCIAFVSKRKGVTGAMVTVGNPLADGGWFPLRDLTLGGSSWLVVKKYL